MGGSDPRSGGAWGLQAVADFAQQHHVFRRCHGFWCGSWSFPFDAVDLLDHQKDDESQNGEIHRHGDETAIGEYRHAGFFQGVQRGAGAWWHTAQNQKQIGKIELSKGCTHDRHDEVTNHGVHNFSKRSTNDDTHRKVNHIALDSEVPEFLNHSHSDTLQMTKK